MKNNLIKKVKKKAPKTLFSRKVFQFKESLVKDKQNNKILNSKTKTKTKKRHIP